LVNTEPGIFADFDWELTGNGFEVAFTDSSQNGTSYFWDFGNGNTSTLQNPVVVYTQPGEYIVKFAVTNICGTDTSTQTIQLINDGIDLWPYQQIKIHPNPTSSLTLVTLPEAKAWSLRVLDLRGREVRKEVLQGSSHTLDTRHLPAGVYLLEVSDGKATDRKKLMVRR
ncbi:MAG: PKD domain-containing protein, partial [Bacteroidia bacterium]|nr:PKD domain-containing protein [Bacteroidia bacterium]